MLVLAALTVARVIGGGPIELPEVPRLQSPIGMCSGVVVGERTILTAAHCVCDPARGTRCLRDLRRAPLALTATLPAGDDATAVTICVPRRFAFPRHDLAVVHVDRALPVPPRRLALDRVAFGSELVIAGWSTGRLEAAAVTKSMCRLDDLPAGTTCFDVAPDRPNTCFGDSGGPMLDRTGAVVAITSGGVTFVGVGTSAGACSGEGVSWATTLATHAGWLRRALAADDRDCVPLR